jgi:hypothetical protein
VLAGQAMTCRLNAYLSNLGGLTCVGGTNAGDACTVHTDCTGGECQGGAGGFPITGSYSSFTVPSSGIVCTRRFGTDNALGGGDDICAAFVYPSCVLSQSIPTVHSAANSLLGTGTDAVLGCSAADLNTTLSNFNEQFDGCGQVIDCGSVTTAGPFTCNPL